MFGEVFSKEITPALVGVWHGIFDRLPPMELEQAFTETLHTSRFFPVPADVLGKIAAREALAGSSQAEAEWMKAWEASGHDSKCELTDAGNYGIRLIGGWDALFSLGAVKQEPFLRKSFIEAHGRYREREKLGISDGDSKNLLERLGQKSLTEKTQ